MAYESNSPNMLLPVPGVGQTTGPQYALDVNSCMTIIDQHNHSNGSGVQITPSGLNINSDLSINSNNLILARTVRFTPQASALSAPDLGCVYVLGAELCYNDVNGNVVPLTHNGSVAGTNGSIGGLVAPASLNYAVGTFVFQSNVNTSAALDAGSIILRNTTASSQGLTLQPPNAMGFSYTITLPSPPAAQAFVTLDTSGNLSGSVPIANGITMAMLAAAVQQTLTPSGTIHAYGGTTPPTGYLMCDGSAVSRTTYASLYASISTNFGPGDGSTTFNLPNTEGIFLRGAGSQVISGSTYSTSLGSVTGDTMQGHIHNENANVSIGQSGIANGAVLGLGNGGTQASGGTNYNTSVPINDGTNGTPRTGFETKPANLGVNYIIKT